MRLTIEEFKTLRAVQWISRTSCDDRVYYTPVNEVSTVLFNMDLLRKILVPKFSKQNTVVNIENFDVTVPMILRPDLTIELPTDFETAMFFAEQRLSDTNNSILSTRVSLNFTFVITIIIYSFIILFIYLMQNFSPEVVKIFSNRII
ncbi:MAG: hypothetical protein ACRYE7_01010 [Janthinobacterium lividum]